jgi:hypothetical protein
VEETSFEVEKRFWGFVWRCVPKEEKRLFRIVAAVADSCNLEDFLNSIRLMSAGRTTIPYPVEENSGV